MGDKIKLTLSLVLSVLLLLAATAPNSDERRRRLLPWVDLNAECYQLLKDGNWAEAIEELEDAYNATSGDPNLRYYLAYCHYQLATIALKQKKYQESITQLESSIQYVDHYPEVYSNLGLCHFILSQYSQAEDCFQKVLELEPDHFLAHKQLGELHYLNGDNEKALSHWQKAIEVNPDDAPLKKRLRSLQKLLKRSHDFETEFGNTFIVIFNGKKSPQLRDKVVAVLEDIFLKIMHELNLFPHRQISVVLLTNQSFFNITDSPDWAGGVYEGQIKIPVGNYNPELLKIVLCHEYIHAVLFDRLSVRCPWWLNEGLAQYFSGDTKGNTTKRQLAAKLLPEMATPLLDGLPGNQRKSKKQVAAAYSLALSAVHYFMETHNANTMQSILDLMAEGQTFERALQELTSYSMEEFERDWIESIGQ